MITIHHLDRSRSERAIWVMEELGAPYTLRWYKRLENLSAEPAYKALHPLGSSPVIEVDGQMIAESGAVVEYLATTQGGRALALGPRDPAYGEYLFWFHFAESSLMPEITREIMAEHLGIANDHPSRQWSRARTAMFLDHVNGRLGEAPWFAGAQFTAADIMMAFPFTTTRQFTPVDIGSYPNIITYLDRIEQRPAYRRCRELADQS